MLAHKELERGWVGSAVRCWACAGRDAFIVNRYNVQVQVLGPFWGRQRLFSKDDVQGWSCGSYGIIKSWLACMLYVYSLRLA